MKLFFPLIDRKYAWTYDATLARLGVSKTIDPAAADCVLPLFDSRAVALAGHPRFMSASAVDVLLNKDRLHETGVPTLPTTVIDADTPIPDGYISKTRNPATGGLVMQPHLGFPQEDIDLTVSVNAHGVAQVYNAMRLLHHGLKDPGSARSATAAEAALVASTVQSVVDLLGIKGGIHNVQFLEYQGQWCLTDWNPRPGYGTTLGMVQQYPCMDAPLAHMLGLPEPAVAAPVFVTREYRNPPLPASADSTIRSLGLLPRANDAGLIMRVNGVAGDLAALNAKFDHMETLCAT